ncbi:MAG: hypothetical protein HQK84_10320, partial [Nitrospinae bacterium]|nr:hypothetical protein [Nitrospinota bacterium]
EGLSDLSGKIEKLTSILFDTEDKMNTLGEKMKILNTTEEKLNELQLLFEDVNVKLKGLQKENESIDKASDQIAELRFLMGEVERKMQYYSGLTDKDSNENEGNENE